MPCRLIIHLSSKIYYSVSQAMRQKTVSLQSIMQQLLLLFYCLNKGITWHQIAYYITNIFTVFNTEPRSLSHNFVVFGGTMGLHCCWMSLSFSSNLPKKCPKICNPIHFCDIKWIRIFFFHERVYF